MTVSTKPFFSYTEINQTATYIQRHTRHQPTIGLILGSGLSPLAEQIEQADTIPYENVPHFPVSGVLGHAGKLVIGQLAGQNVLVMQGRSHFYEGYTMQHLTLPVRAMQLLGLKTLIVTNAAGGINPAFNAGDLMLITDHINMVGFGGNNPLAGPNLEQFGPRFPSMTQAYSLEMLALARRAAADLGLTVQEGVYAALAGPTFETPAEIRFLHTIGADAVGMSTVPEVIVANHGGMRVLGVSSITNVAIHTTSSTVKTTHEEVLETGQIIVPKLMALLQGTLAQMA